MSELIKGCCIFDKYADFYGNVKPCSYDYYFINFIRKTRREGSALVDIGGGSGTFAKLVKSSYPDIDVTVVDPSKELLNKLSDECIKRAYGKLPDKIFLDTKFDYVHIKEVFHHIVGFSVNSSRRLLRNSLFTIRKLLKEDGFLFIHKLFYESYLIPALSRTLIFYLLTLQNSLRIKVPIKEFLMDLKVCFHTRTEFKSILNGCGFEIIDFHEEYWSNSFKKSAVFLRNWGRMLFIVKKVS